MVGKIRLETGWLCMAGSNYRGEKFGGLGLGLRFHGWLRLRFLSQYYPSLRGWFDCLLIYCFSCTLYSVIM